MRIITLCVMLSTALLMLTACQTTPSRADLITICHTLAKTRVTVTKAELALLSRETINMIKANYAVARQIGCVK
jgi:hypothetical protein